MPVSKRKIAPCDPCPEFRAPEHAKRIRLIGKMKREGPSFHRPLPPDMRDRIQGPQMPFRQIAVPCFSSAAEDGTYLKVRRGIELSC